MAIVSTVAGSEACCVAIDGGRQDVRNGTAGGKDLYKYVVSVCPADMDSAGED